MYCMKCGYENADGQAYCIKCGAQLAVVSQINSKNDLKSTVLGLALGKKISGAAGALALLCFFLPWVTVSCGASWQLSGYDLATFSTPSYYDQSSVPPARLLLFGVPLAALLILANVIRAWNAFRAWPTETRVQRETAAATMWSSVLGGLITLAALLYFEYARHDPEGGGLAMLMLKIEPEKCVSCLKFNIVVFIALFRSIKSGHIFVCTFVPIVLCR